MIDEVGPCCVCGHDDGTVRNIVFMPFEAPAGFRGWGCSVCDLPARGALAVVCDDCVGDQGKVRLICGGERITEGARLKLKGFVKTPFRHRKAAHQMYSLEPATVSSGRRLL